MKLIVGCVHRLLLINADASYIRYNRAQYSLGHLGSRAHLKQRREKYLLITIICSMGRGRQRDGEGMGSIRAFVCIRV